MFWLAASSKSEVVQILQQLPDMLSPSVQGAVVSPDGDDDAGASEAKHRYLDRPGR
jgi:hypothetical protein